MLTVVGVVVAAEQSQFGQIKIKISALQHKQRVLRLLPRRKPRNHHNPEQPESPKQESVWDVLDNKAPVEEAMPAQ